MRSITWMAVFSRGAAVFEDRSVIVRSGIEHGEFYVALRKAAIATAATPARAMNLVVEGA